MSAYDPSYAKYMDHTVLKADTTRKTLRKFCDEAKEYGFASVCVNSGNVEFVARQLSGSPVKTCCVVGFPLGANTTATKVFETREAIRAGAREIDMVINVGAFKDGDLDRVHDDIRAVVEAAKPDALVKVILETCLLTDEEKVEACRIAERAGADFVKTSTGFGSGGATVEDVTLMAKTVGPRLGIKASTGINTREICDAMLAAGATRFGTSKGPFIVQGTNPGGKGY